MRTNISTNKGFTIVETLVAITILMISIAGPLTIAQKSLNAANQAKDQVTASYLAQDQMELIKNARDNSSDFSGTGGSFYNQFCLTIANCTTAVLNTTPDGAYTTGNGTPSKFSRFATLDQHSPYNATVKVTVTWQSGPIKNSYVLENQLFDVKL